MIARLRLLAHDYILAIKMPVLRLFSDPVLLLNSFDILDCISRLQTLYYLGIYQIYILCFRHRYLYGFILFSISVEIRRKIIVLLVVSFGVLATRKFLWSITILAKLGGDSPNIGVNLYALDAFLKFWLPYGSLRYNCGLFLSSTNALSIKNIDIFSNENVQNRIRQIVLIKWRVKAVI